LIPDFASLHPGYKERHGPASGEINGEALEIGERAVLQRALVRGA
jgi:hypothetical protein